MERQIEQAKADRRLAIGPEIAGAAGRAIIDGIGDDIEARLTEEANRARQTFAGRSRSRLARQLPASAIEVDDPIERTVAANIEVGTFVELRGRPWLVEELRGEATDLQSLCLSCIII